MLRNIKKNQFFSNQKILKKEKKTSKIPKKITNLQSTKTQNKNQPVYQHFLNQINNLIVFSRD